MSIPAQGDQIERRLVARRQIDGAASIDEDEPVEARQRHLSWLDRDALE